MMETVRIYLDNEPVEWADHVEVYTEQIDVTTMGDAGRRYVPGITTATLSNWGGRFETIYTSDIVYRYDGSVWIYDKLTSPERAEVEREAAAKKAEREAAADAARTYWEARGVFVNDQRLHDRDRHESMWTAHYMHLGASGVYLAETKEEALSYLEYGEDHGELLAIGVLAPALLIGDDGRLLTLFSQ